MQASTNALRVAAADYFKIFSPFDLHVMFKRATPNQWGHYVSLLTMYRIINNRIPEFAWLNLQCSALPLTRSNKTLFPPNNRLRAGTNTILNRLSFVSTMIQNNDLNLEYLPFKLMVKRLILNIPDPDLRQ